MSLVVGACLWSSLPVLYGSESLKIIPGMGEGNGNVCGTCRRGD